MSVVRRAQIHVALGPGSLPAICLKQDGIPVKIEEGPLSARKATHVHRTGRIDPHPLQGWPMGHRRNDEPPVGAATLCYLSWALWHLGYFADWIWQVMFSSLLTGRRGFRDTQRRRRRGSPHGAKLLCAACARSSPGMDGALGGTVSNKRPRRHRRSRASCPMRHCAEIRTRYRPRTFDSDYERGSWRWPISP
jgi:hypothetical protein